MIPTELTRAHVLAALADLARERVVVVGRAMGRVLGADARFYLDTPLALRAARRGVSEDALAARDAADAARGA